MFLFFFLLLLFFFLYCTSSSQRELRYTPFVCSYSVFKPVLSKRFFFPSLPPEIESLLSNHDTKGGEGGKQSIKCSDRGKNFKTEEEEEGFIFEIKTLIFVDFF